MIAAPSLPSAPDDPLPGTAATQTLKEGTGDDLKSEIQHRFRCGGDGLAIQALQAAVLTYLTETRS